MILSFTVYRRSSVVGGSHLPGQGQGLLLELWRTAGASSGSGPCHQRRHLRRAGHVPNRRTPLGAELPPTTVLRVRKDSTLN